MTFALFAEEVLWHTAKEVLLLLPFLFLTYLFMEFLEHRAGDGMKRTIQRAGRFGPFFGSVLGIVPQCGFSAAASGLYAGRVISLGTLIAVFLSTSDEMLPILVSSGAPALLIVKLLAIKVLVGMAAGFILDLVLRLLHKDVCREHHEHHDHIHELCEHEGCDCEADGILKSALKHTLHIAFFMLLIVFLLNLGLFFLGHDTLSALFTKIPVLGHLLAGVVGLIPNCASSVLITKLYLEGLISAGCMMSGLLVGAGIGTLVLLRTYHPRRRALGIIGLLYAIGTVSGMLLDLVGIGAIL
ncbi:MAG: arsenic efflux protein [Clostridia bacterium]|nr:arsenic efflux protein [Clostridia bacterium]